MGYKEAFAIGIFAFAVGGCEPVNSARVLNTDCGPDRPNNILVIKCPNYSAKSCVQSIIDLSEKECKEYKYGDNYPR